MATHDTSIFMVHPMVIAVEPPTATVDANPEAAIAVGVHGQRWAVHEFADG